MFCMKCGTELPEVAQFCFKCGTPVPSSSNSVATQSAISTTLAPKLQVSSENNKCSEYSYAMYKQDILALIKGACSFRFPNMIEFCIKYSEICNNNHYCPAN